MMLRKTDWLDFILKRFIWVIITLTFLLFSVVIKDYMSLPNIINIFLTASVLGVMVVGQSLCLIGRKLDLSAEGILTLAATISAWLMLPYRTMDLGQAGGIGWELHPFVVIPSILVIGTFVGFLNGFMIMKLKMNFFIVTLSMQLLLRGLAYVISQGAVMPGTPPLYNWLGGGRIGPIPISIVAMLALYALFHFVMNNTRFGREVYAIGANEDAARASGLHPERTMIIVYSLSGLMAALAGWMLLGKLEASVPTLGVGLTLDVVAAAVIGGVSLKGGEGSIISAFAGVLLLAMINNALNLMNINPFWVNALRGVIILAALILDAQKNRYKGKLQPHVARSSEVV